MLPHITNHPVRDFEQLVTKGRELTQLDPIKLGAHIKFCTEQMDKVRGGP